jgi:hypothetical protein
LDRTSEFGKNRLSLLFAEGSVAENRAMSIWRQASYPESALCRFLDARLPQRRLIIDDWARQAGKAPWSAIMADVGYRSGLGLAAEYRIGLDLAEAPGYWDLLSFLSPMECNILLRGAGYCPAEHEHMAETGTTDPLLLAWVRDRHPIALSEAQRLTLLACWAMAQISDLAEPHSQIPVQSRRSFLAHRRSDLRWDARMANRPHPVIDALSHLWQGYLRHGRRQLTGLGERVMLAPELADRFGIADIMVGRCLVEIKTALEPEKGLEQWLNQLLGYVLLDWFDALRIDTVALYLGWQAKLIATPVSEVLAASTPGPTPMLGLLRADFRQAIQADLDETHQWQLNRRYP